MQGVGVIDNCSGHGGQPSSLQQQIILLTENSLQLFFNVYLTGTILSVYRLLAEPHAVTHGFVLFPILKYARKKHRVTYVCVTLNRK